MISVRNWRTLHREAGHTWRWIFARRPNVWLARYMGVFPSPSPNNFCVCASLDPDNGVHVAPEFCVMRLQQILSDNGQFPTRHRVPGESNVRSPVCIYQLGGKSADITISRVKLKSLGKAKYGLDDDLVVRAGTVVGNRI